MIRPWPLARRVGSSLGMGLGLAGLATMLVAAPAAGEAPPTSISVKAMPHVLVIGDSTTFHMLAQFRQALAEVGLDATVDAKSGRTTHQGRQVLAGYESSAFDYVVVLLGANGRRANAVSDMRALKAAGVDTMATVQAPKRGIVNSAVRKVFGADRIRWAGYADRHGIATTDGKHYSAADYATRAQYIARQISARVSSVPPRVL